MKNGAMEHGAGGDFDLAIIGGGLLGSLAAIMFQRRGLRALVLESRPEGKDQKVVVGEALTEGTSVFLRHELGLTDWLMKNAYRKFGFDFLVRPRKAGGEAALPATAEECHELLLSLTPIEKIPQAFPRLIPTFHVERTAMNRHVAEVAQQAGAVYLHGTSVERVDFDDGREGSHAVRYAGEDGVKKTARCRFVLDCSGRRQVLARQLGITRAVEDLDTASVWNRFSNVNADPAFWRTFHGIDRRRHTIHGCGPGFWIWWIHISSQLTSVGVSYDRAQHQPDTKSDDRGFGEMIRKFPPLEKALAGARPLEPFQYYAHLPYQSSHWLSPRYAIIGDAAWFTDALYSIGIETACRQLMNARDIIQDAGRGRAPCADTIATLNREFENTQRSVVHLNRFKYKQAWHRPHVLMQSAVYELGEIAELYYLQDKKNWNDEVLKKHYRLQWNSEARGKRLRDFLDGSLLDGDRDLRPGAGLLKKALLPGKNVYRATWPLWNVSGAAVYFFHLIRGWAYSERINQRYRLWPDGLGFMATDRDFRTLIRGAESQRSATR